MEQKESYINQCKAISKNLTIMAKKNQLSLVKVVQIYNKFNYALYSEDLANGGEFSMYKPSLEEKALNLTEAYFNIPRN
jgi:hypothetical protein